jgi:hypothetical protein
MLARQLASPGPSLLLAQNRDDLFFREPATLHRPSLRQGRTLILRGGKTRSLSREKSLIAERSEMKGNSGHTSKTNFGSDICEFESFRPKPASAVSTMRFPRV